MLSRLRSLSDDCVIDLSLSLCAPSSILFLFSSLHVLHPQLPKTGVEEQIKDLYDRSGCQVDTPAALPSRTPDNYFIF